MLGLRGGGGGEGAEKQHSGADTSRKGAFGQGRVEGGQQKHGSQIRFLCSFQRTMRRGGVQHAHGFQTGPLGGAKPALCSMGIKTFSTFEGAEKQCWGQGAGSKTHGFQVRLVPSIALCRRGGGGAIKTGFAIFGAQGADQNILCSFLPCQSQPAGAKNTLGIRALVKWG